MADTIQVVGDRDKLKNDVVAAWYDEGNSEGYSNVDPDADPDADIVWIQPSHFTDQTDRVGIPIKEKGKVIKTLISRGNIYGEAPQKRWSGGKRERFHPFNPDTLGVMKDDIVDTEPTHSEVDV